jgi:HEAT repeat protein
MPLIRKNATSTPTARLDPAAVLVALASGTEDERWEAARAASGIPGAAKALCDAAWDETSARVREAIFTSITRIATPESVELLLPLLRSDAAPLRTGALDAMRAMKGVAWPYVPSLLRDANSDVRLLACELARDQPGKDSAPLLCELLESDPEPNVCASAVEVLAEIGGPEALAALERCKERFRGVSFLEFAIGTTIERIRSTSSQPRA